MTDEDIHIGYVKYIDYLRDLFIVFKREGYNACESVVKRIESPHLSQLPGREYETLLWAECVSVLKDSDVLKKGWMNITEEERQHTGPEQARRLGARQSPDADLSLDRMTS
jgi:hypothetical protein